MDSGLTGLMASCSMRNSHTPQYAYGPCVQPGTPTDPTLGDTRNWPLHAQPATPSSRCVRVSKQSINQPKTARNCGPHCLQPAHPATVRQDNNRSYPMPACLSHTHVRVCTLIVGACEALVHHLLPSNVAGPARPWRDTASSGCVDIACL